MTYGKYNNTREFTPSANILDPMPKALRFDTEESITLQAANSSVPVTINVIAGEILPVQTLKVIEASTVAHGLA